MVERLQEDKVKREEQSVIYKSDREDGEVQ